MLGFKPLLCNKVHLPIQLVASFTHCLETTSEYFRIRLHLTPVSVCFLLSQSTVLTCLLLIVLQFCLIANKYILNTLLYTIHAWIVTVLWNATTPHLFHFFWHNICVILKKWTKNILNKNVAITVLSEFHLFSCAGMDQQRSGFSFGHFINVL